MDISVHQWTLGAGDRQYYSLNSGELRRHLIAITVPYPAWIGSSLINSGRGMSMCIYMRQIFHARRQSPDTPMDMNMPCPELIGKLPIQAGYGTVMAIRGRRQASAC